MTRIFVTMAWINALALAASVVLGFMYREAGSAAPSPEQPLGATWFMWHFVVGLFTAIFTLQVHCLIFTYFLGTGRWVKEVARAYEFPDQGWPRQTREFKRKAFPPALFAMLANIATVASGAGVQTQMWPHWTHWSLAVVTLVLNGYAFVIEYRMVSANARVIEEVVAEANRRRAEM